MQIQSGRATNTRGHVDPPAFPPLAGLALGLIAFSTSSIMTRYAQAYAPSLVIAAYRLGLASLVVVPLAVGRYGGALRRLHRGELLLSVTSGAFLAIHFATWITSLEYTTVASSLVLVWTSPLFVALLSPWTLRESISRPVRIGLIISLTGSVLVGLSDACAWRAGIVCPPASEFLHGRAIFGDMLAVAGAIGGAGYIILGRRLRPSVELIPYISIAYGTAAVLLSAAVGALGLPASGYPLQAYGWFALLALMPQLIAHSTYNWALRYLPAAYVSVALLGEPVGSTILAYLLLGEHPAVLMLAGSALILTGILIASRRPNAPSTVESAAPLPG
jgi:drug/metabolite transporter (DMT)-like permease